MGAEIKRKGLFAMQVCVPKDWTENQILDFAEEANPCGTEHGWQIRRQMEEEPNYQERGVWGSSRPGSSRPKGIERSSADGKV